MRGLMETQLSRAGVGGERLRWKRCCGVVEVDGEKGDGGGSEQGAS